MNGQCSTIKTLKFCKDGIGKLILNKIQEVDKNFYTRIIFSTKIGMCPIRDLGKQNGAYLENKVCCSTVKFTLTMKRVDFIRVCIIIPVTVIE